MMKITLTILLLVLYTSCATHKPQVFKQEKIEKPVQQISGLSYLIDEIDLAIQRNRFDRAAEIAQRGLRITPNNAVLWQRLALVELKLGNYAQAEQNALRSIRFSSENRELIGINNHLIAEARALSD